MSEQKRKPRNAEEVVEFFLGSVVARGPEEWPKQEYRQREIAAEIRGYNKAQEHLRDFLAQIEGKTKTAERGRKLAECRHEDQVRPQNIGGQRVWLA